MAPRICIVMLPSIPFIALMSNTYSIAVGNSRYAVYMLVMVPRMSELGLGGGDFADIVRGILVVGCDQRRSRSEIPWGALRMAEWLTNGLSIMVHLTTTFPELLDVNRLREALANL